MMKSILSVMALTLVAASARAALPGNEAEGKRLHDASCTGCHDAAVYTRKDHRVRSLDGLKQQVENCTHMAQKEFSPADKQDILKYLNDEFYHFDQAGKP
jgi:cytochrome c553